MKKFILPVVILFFCVNVFSQQAFNNMGNLQIHPGASLSGFGNFTNASSGVLVNNGSLYVRGNLTNNQASMSAGSGTLYLNGSTAQAVNGSQVFKTNNLQTDNSSGLTLDNDLSISGTHTFVNGLIITSSIPNYLIYEAGSSHTSSNDSRHVAGWVKKIGSTAFTFPVGDATYLRTAGITNLSASSEFNCHYYTPTANTNNLTSPLVKVKANEYWQIDRISGGSAQVILNWDHSKVAMDNIALADIVVGQYTGGSWTNAGGSASGNVTTTGTVTSNSIASFSPFTLAYRSFPIPLKMLSFTAERRSGTSYLKWVTENEENVSHFDVQRSYDGGQYTTIGNVAARNSGSLERYNFEDHDLLIGLAYYRIKSIDLDGKFSYSRIAIVSETDFGSSSFVVLNPVREAITIFNKTGREGAYNYQVFNTGGQLICKGNVTMGINGGAILPLPASVAAGQYILELSSGTYRFRQKILVQ